MKKGFTIIELLVASLLLGMLVTILTMVFNQSSIAWRIGTASVGGVNQVCDNLAELRDEADNAFIAKVGGSYVVLRHVGLWDSNGNLRDRSCNAPGSKVESANLGAEMLKQGGLTVTASTEVKDIIRKTVNINAGSQDKKARTYTVNVMSAGPDKTFDTWDDIWSWPDDFE